MRGRCAVVDLKQQQLTLRRGCLPRLKRGFAHKRRFAHPNKTRQARLERVAFGDQIGFPMQKALLQTHGLYRARAKMGQPMVRAGLGDCFPGRVKLVQGHVDFISQLPREADCHDGRGHDADKGLSHAQPGKGLRRPVATRHRAQHIA